MKFGRGAEGKEVIPNVDIWIQIPSLVKVSAEWSIFSINKR